MDQRKDELQNNRVSRRKLLALLGAGGAAVLSAGALHSLGTGHASAAGDDGGKRKPAVYDADRIAYRHSADQAERIAADKLRECPSVKDFGAAGDGAADDTPHINAAIDWIHAQGGGTLKVPQGTYRIDAAKADNAVPGGVMMKSGVSLVFDRGAVFQAIPNASPYYAIISVMDCEDVAIAGAALVGDRDEHLGSGGEWGHGIQILNSQRVTVADAHVSRCWGDGIYLRTVDRITLINSVFDSNRRQGMSILGGTNLYFWRCDFCNTNGTDPQAGVDIEPSQSWEVIRNVTFDGCRFLNNQGRGLVMDIRYGATCENVNVVNSISTGNVSQSIRIATRSSSVVRNITLSNVTTEHINMGNLGEAAIVNVSIDRTDCDRMIFRNMDRLSVSQSTFNVRALVMESVSHARIDHVRILNSSESGILLNNGVNEHVALEHVEIMNGAGHGILASASSARYVSVTNSLIRGNALAGIESASDDWIISNCFIQDNGAQGIRMAAGAKRNIITGNSFSGNAQGHIADNGDASHVIANNVTV